MIDPEYAASSNVNGGAGTALPVLQQIKVLWNKQLAWLEGEGIVETAVMVADEYDLDMGYTPHVFADLNPASKDPRLLAVTGLVLTRVEPTSNGTVEHHPHRVDVGYYYLGEGETRSSSLTIGAGQLASAQAMAWPFQPRDAQLVQDLAAEVSMGKWLEPAWSTYLQPDLILRQQHMDQLFLNP